MDDKLIVCYKCGSPLVLEKIGNYGKVYRLHKDGTVGSYVRQYHYPLSESDIQVYCPMCGWSCNGELKDGVFTMRKRTLA